jgi:diketogulonate reductase-like aldo/keto reductase
MELDDRGDVVRALRRGLDLGMNHIDTAEMYGNGKVERVLAKAIEGRRADVYLASKVLPSNSSYRRTLRACEGSLQRLQTDYLDLYLLHWPGNHPLEETIRAFDKLLQDGKIRAYGVSNFDARQVEEAVRLAGPKRIACNQVLYHLGERGIEHEVIPACQRHGVSVVGYSPFGGGRFPSARSKGGKVLGEIADSRAVLPRQVALAFLTRHGVFAIPKSSRREHVEENAAAADLVLSQDEMRRLDEAFPLGPRRPGVPTL